ncbi:hypothetical protein F9C07_2235171 [Aspergillus flavus]|uniref:Uncharacterized protein n=1 Tax=Aspergillus flavus (strain ATCC 200026 / FGSC A1120 / IAM 13836 / NRRL 3357 / JCM 12722 / SRRC 167) TaxID=332952 RepID=A0A7U2R2B9_ASPFN|nr:hypothetical protein F9C07_2235171 [Aspergillus flavus]
MRPAGDADDAAEPPTSINIGKHTLGSGILMGAAVSILYISATLEEHYGIAGICENNQMELSGPPDASNEALDSFKALCDDVLANSKKYFQPLLDRIERKIEEVKGLRDGLFNAISAKDASKGTKLAKNSCRQNRYILVFSVVTVFYLPKDFVTVPHP